MLFTEPKVEFVGIDLINTGDVIIPSQCDQETTKKGSVVSCTGDDSPDNNCCEDDTVDPNWSA